MAGIKSRLSLLPSVLLCRDSPSPRSLDPHSYMASPLRCSFHRALLLSSSSSSSAFLPSKVVTRSICVSVQRICPSQPADGRFPTSGGHLKGVTPGSLCNFGGRAPWVLAISRERLGRADVLSVGTDGKGQTCSHSDTSPLMSARRVCLRAPRLGRGG